MIQINIRRFALLKRYADWQKKYEKTVSIWLNHLAVVYAFLLPLDQPRAGAVVIWSMFLLVMIRGHYRVYFKNVFTHPVTLALVAFYALHWGWNLYLGTPPILVHVFKENIEYGLLFPLLLGVLDQRYAHRVIGAFLLAIMFSELISYGMHFGIFPTEVVFHGVQVPWHASAKDIIIYTQGAFYTGEPVPFIKHSAYTGALAFCVAVMLYRLLNQLVSGFYTFIMIFFMLTMTFNISIVGGRTGYVIYVALVMIVLIMTYKRKVFIPLVASFSVISIIGLSAYTISPMFQKRIDYTIENVIKMIDNPKDFNSSEGGRIGMWYYGSEVIKEYFWFGFPEANFVKPVHELVPYSDRKLFEDWFFMPHGFYLSTLLQFGIFGFILLLNVLIQMVRRQRENLDELYTIRLLAVAVVGMNLLTADLINYYSYPFLVTIAAATMSQHKYIKIIPPVYWKTIGGYSAILLSVLIIAVLQ